VVSHSCEENIRRDYTAHFGVLPQEIYGWDLPEHLRKPSTYPLEQIMQHYGFRPEEILVVDDMKPAYDMCSKAGVEIAFAKWGKADYIEICQQMEELCNYTFETTDALEKFLFD
jgi:phosphoglycolate phosphatase/pyrophosphatase PpaX